MNKLKAYCYILNMNIFKTLIYTKNKKMNFYIYTKKLYQNNLIYVQLNLLISNYKYQ